MNKTVEQIKEILETETKKALSTCTDQEIYLALLKMVEKERDPQDTGERQKAVLYQCRISDRKASFQQPDQFRTL